MLASMSEIDRRVDLPPVDWSDLGVSGLLPTGTATLLLADVEGSTRLWETQPEVMTAAVARLNQTVSEVIAAYGGVRPVEQGEGDSFVAAFTRASDAVACALELQRAPLAPIRLRIGVHTGEVQLRDEGNYAGPTINRTARLRDLAHGGQTVLSGATEVMVVDRLPPAAWLTDLGTHPLRDLPRPERVVQLCHPDVRVEFPPLRTPKTIGAHNLPVQLTSFVGRAAEMRDVCQLLADNRLVTVTGAGGAGKTRLAVEIAARNAPEFRDGVWYVDLAPIAHPAVVPVTVARALGLPDQPGRSTMDTLVRFVRDRQMLVVLDNCEHLLYLLQPADRDGGGGRSHPFVRGEVGHPDRTLIEQRDQDGQLRKRQIVGRGPAGVSTAQDRKELGQCAVQPLRQLRQLRGLRFAVRHNRAV